MTVKSKLLGILEQQKGETLSGEKLAEELHCTRAAIWKAVKSLREEGYTIEAGQNKGYMLVKDSHRLSMEAIQPFLVSPEVYLKVYQEIDSTNRAAKEALWQGSRQQEEDGEAEASILRRKQDSISVLSLNLAGASRRAFCSPQRRLWQSIRLSFGLLVSHLEASG